MDKTTFLKAIKPYKSFLEEAIYKNLSKNAENLNDQEKEKILRILSSAHKILSINKSFMQGKNTLLQEAITFTKKVKAKFQKNKKDFYKKRENEEKTTSAKTAEALINNL